MLSREDILGADDLAREAVQVPEWGGTVYVRVMTGEERDLFEASMMSDNETDRSKRLLNLRARLAALTLCDEHGVSLFVIADYAVLGRKSGRVLERIFDAARKLNALAGEDVKVLVDQLKNDQSVDSGSG